ncbi:MAG TPA: hydroxymethylbilane synthase [Candidatus Eisenbacteria bacterium]|jgi:hydroxymethylbilane synthase
MSAGKTIRVGVRANRLGHILGEQVAELLRPHLGQHHVTFVAVPDSEGTVRYGARWPGLALMEAVEKGTVDVAVQNMKDVPLEPLPHVALTAVTERFTPFDVLIARDETILDELPVGSAISAHTPLRRAQLLHYRDDLGIVDYSGSLDDRIRMLERGEVDGLIVSASAVEHLGYQERVTEVLTTDVVVPAAGQGALGLQIHKGQKELARIVRRLDDPVARAEVDCERAFLRELRAGGRVATAALARLAGDVLTIEGVVADRDGQELYRDAESGDRGDEFQVAARLARRLLLDGARHLLAAAGQGTG